MENVPVRKKIRLDGYDYSRAGRYSITVCTENRNCYFWENPDTEDVIPELSEYGKIAKTAIENIGARYDRIHVDKYVVMPNHIHLLITVDEGNTKNLSDVMTQMKSWVTKQIGFSLWQSRFYDRVIGSDAEYENVKRYIIENPIKWQFDEYHG